MATKENLRKAASEDTFRSLRWEWYKQRAETVHQRVSAYEVLRRNGVPLRQLGDDQSEQFSCPFHGVDRRPSAKVYPESHSGPSHAWCFVCQERWDAIGLWRKFAGTLTFPAALADIEKAYGIAPPPLPRELVGKADDPNDIDLEEFLNLHATCESRLRMARPAYQRLDNMNAFLLAGQILDKLRYRVDQRLMPPDRAILVLQQLLPKIGEKLRLYPDL